MYRIFLVEDDHALAQALRGELERCGYEVRAVSDFRRVSEEFRRCSIRANVWGGIMGPCNNIITALNIRPILIWIIIEHKDFSIVIWRDGHCVRLWCFILLKFDVAQCHIATVLCLI